MATGNNNTCSNLYCHGGYAGSNGSLTVPSWTAGATAKGCGACHGVSQATPPTSGNHVRHTGTATGNMGIACSDCHGTLPANNAHVNGNVVTSLNPASKLRANATYKALPTSLLQRSAMAPVLFTATARFRILQPLLLQLRQ
ncbi:CxxxxCH/CxxCH domain c-type cytochrome [Geotalea toluenoxydans]|uniref:CxxxxCH/CxxCH domain c-type cytochrome n=1 Tax=Geotalea toluenoxydans TaxID=421624 RepID=UPI003F6EE159